MTKHSPSLLSALATLSTERDALQRLEDALAGPSGATQLGTQFCEAIERITHMTGRLVVTGIGKSGHIGRKIHATLASTGTASLFLHPAEAAHGDLGMIAPGDIVLALSNSGETAELTAILRYAAHQSLCVLAITSAPDSALARAADVALVLPTVREACPMGLAPTTSTLLLLALGDALAIALLEKRGFTPEDFRTFHPGGSLGARLRPVRDLMHQGNALPIGGMDLPLRSVIVEMTRKAFGCMGVIDSDGRLCGLISDGDLRRVLDRDLDATTAADVMNPKPIVTTPDTLSQDVATIMHGRAKPITSLFVLDDARRPLGIVHLHDLLRAGAV